MRIFEISLCNVQIQTEDRYECVFIRHIYDCFDVFVSHATRKRFPFITTMFYD